MTSDWSGARLGGCANSDRGHFWTAVLALSLFEGAYVAEIFRAALLSVPDSQWEAALSLGLNLGQALWSVILSQAWRNALGAPDGAGNLRFQGFGARRPDSLPDLTFQSLEIMAVSGMTFEIWTSAAALYLLIGMAASRWPQTGKNFFPIPQTKYLRRTFMPAYVVEHPLVRHKLGLLRSADTPTSEFRRLANEIAGLLLYEATKDLPMETRIVKGWAGLVEVTKISGKKMTVVPILRAGLGLMDGVLNMIPSARISVVGMYRNESTLQPVEYYVKLAGDLSRRFAIILDPMLATGGSLDATINILKKHGCEHICSLNLVCAPEGIALIEKNHPDVKIFTAAIDDGLNENGYILPGLGDAGDRLFGTK